MCNFLSFSQELDSYSSSTKEAYKELDEILNGDIKRIEEVRHIILDLAKEGVVVLSSNQFSFVELKIEELRKCEGKNSDQYKALKKEVDALTSKYFVITKVVNF